MKYAVQMGSAIEMMMGETHTESKVISKAYFYFFDIREVG
jgi:hypothetical protein